MICPDCGKRMFLQKSRRRYRCEDYPKCRGSHGAHPDGSPMGIAVPREVRLLRAEVHSRLNANWNYRDRNDRARMYDWLRKNSKSGHVAQMNEGELRNLLTKIPVRREVRESLWQHIAKERQRGTTDGNFRKTDR